MKPQKALKKLIVDCYHNYWIIYIYIILLYIILFIFFKFTERKKNIVKYKKRRTNMDKYINKIKTDIRRKYIVN